MTYFLYILLAILILLFMVMIHEAGHYFVAKLFKFEVDEFSIGFGKSIFSFRRRSGELFSLRLVPLGGYCAFYGDDDENSDQTEVNASTAKQTAIAAHTAAIETQGHPRALPATIAARFAAAETHRPARTSFDKQAAWKRILVLMAGAATNFVSAIFFSFLYILIVGYGTVAVSSVYSNGSAPYSQLMAGDVIVAIDGTEIGIMNPYQELAANYKEGDSATFNVLRGGKNIEVVVKKQLITASESSYVGFGFMPAYSNASGNAADAFIYSVPYTFKLAGAIFSSLGDMITGKIGISQLSGPIGSVATIAEYSAQDWRNVLIFLPLIAVNLAIFNILPIPALDGMKILYTGIEWARKKPISYKIQKTVNIVGLILVFGFIIVVDIIGIVVRISKSLY